MWFKFGHATPQNQPQRNPRNPPSAPPILAEKSIPVWHVSRFQGGRAVSFPRHFPSSVRVTVNYTYHTRVFMDGSIFSVLRPSIDPIDVVMT